MKTKLKRSINYPERIRPWTPKDIKSLENLAGSGKTSWQIAEILNRSEGATQQKLFGLKISLRRARSKIAAKTASRKTKR